MVSGLLLDIDGVLVTSWRPIPGAVQAVEQLAQRAIPRMFLTNTTSKSRTQLAEVLTELGFAVAPDEIFSAARLTAEYLRAQHPGATVWVLNRGPVVEDMSGVEVVTDARVTPDVVVLGGAGPEFSHDALSRVFELMVAGVPVIAMHRSMTWSTTEGIRIDTGVYLEGLEKAAGRTIRAIGKPSPWGFRAAVDMLGLDPTSVVMVGDDLHSDVLGAQASALVGVLVRTGKFRTETLAALESDEFAPVPDHIIDSIVDLPALMDRLMTSA
ncbi:HAD-IIA family hydrolase [Williamsia sp. CHRR-6]|uniref:HAD-IIA family hydrolase n=1 Tax=Williamsia sp. CHRR-6 TaxID=2835871 RepID=UPI001BDB5965|nr:HAD-IIA family hydrolase [Williamsia sp. CHRR-6]MBT0567014.1 HAD-IIA family hydrolase [Williamsia sp. CHRR-6]